MDLLQQVINIVYRYPLSKYKTYRRFGGYFEYQKMLNGAQEMSKASLTLPPVKSSSAGLPLYFLTGKNYFFQTLFCIQSLSKVTGREFNFNLVDDGTFDDHLIDLISKKLPRATIINSSEIDTNHKRVLPINDYPVLHAKRKIYPHLKKLTDIHTIALNEWKLVLDSDMLFWNEPIQLLEWLKSPDKPLHMVDCVESYGYSEGLMERLSGVSIPQMINVGAIGLKSSAISWPMLENWVRELEENEGASYYLEQALTAMILGDQAKRLDAEGYIVNPQHVNKKDDILHHYVDLSKKFYFQKAWKNFSN